MPNFNGMFDLRVRRRIERMRRDNVRCFSSVNPTDILEYMRRDVMPITQWQKIERIIDREGDERGMYKLLDEMQKYNGFALMFLKGLRENNHETLARDVMRGVSILDLQFPEEASFLHCLRERNPSPPRSSPPPPYEEMMDYQRQKIEQNRPSQSEYTSGLTSSSIVTSSASTDTTPSSTTTLPHPSPDSDLEMNIPLSTISQDDNIQDDSGLDTVSRENIGLESSCADNTQNTNQSNIGMQGASNASSDSEWIRISAQQPSGDQIVSRTSPTGQRVSKTVLSTIVERSGNFGNDAEDKTRNIPRPAEEDAAQAMPCDVEKPVTSLQPQEMRSSAAGASQELVMDEYVGVDDPNTVPKELISTGHTVINIQEQRIQQDPDGASQDIVLDDFEAGDPNTIPKEIAVREHIGNPHLRHHVEEMEASPDNDNITPETQGQQDFSSTVAREEKIKKNSTVAQKDIADKEKETLESDSFSFFKTVSVQDPAGEFQCSTLRPSELCISDSIKSNENQGSSERNDDLSPTADDCKPVISQARQDREREISSHQLEETVPAAGDTNTEGTDEIQTVEDHLNDAGHEGIESNTPTQDADENDHLVKQTKDEEEHAPQARAEMGAKNEVTNDLSTQEILKAISECDTNIEGKDEIQTEEENFNEAAHESVESNTQTKDAGETVHLVKQTKDEEEEHALLTSPQLGAEMGEDAQNQAANDLSTQEILKATSEGYVGDTNIEGKDEIQTEKENFNEAAHESIESKTEAQGVDENDYLVKETKDEEEQALLTPPQVGAEMGENANNHATNDLSTQERVKATGEGYVGDRNIKGKDEIQTEEEDFSDPPHEGIESNTQTEDAGETVHLVKQTKDEEHALLTSQVGAEKGENAWGQAANDLSSQEAASPEGTNEKKRTGHEEEVRYSEMPEANCSFQSEEASRQADMNDNNVTSLSAENLSHNVKNSSDKTHDEPESPNQFNYSVAVIGFFTVVGSYLMKLKN